MIILKAQPRHKKGTPQGGEWKDKKVNAKTKKGRELKKARTAEKKRIRAYKVKLRKEGKTNASIIAKPKKETPKKKETPVKQSPNKTKQVSKKQVEKTPKKPEAIKKDDKVTDIKKVKVTKAQVVLTGKDGETKTYKAINNKDKDRTFGEPDQYKEYGQWVKNKPDVREAIEDYQGAGYSVLNTYLRNKAAGDNEKTAMKKAMDNNTGSYDFSAKEIKSMQSKLNEAVNHTKISDDTVLTRAMSRNDPIIQAALAVDIGKSLPKESAFMSTTVNKQGVFGGSTVDVKILAPKGTKGMYVNADPNSPNGLLHEQEYILAPGTQMRLISRKKKAGGKMEIVAEIIGQD